MENERELKSEKEQSEILHGVAEEFVGGLQQICASQRRGEITTEEAKEKSENTLEKFKAEIGKSMEQGFDINAIDKKVRGSDGLSIFTISKEVETICENECPEAVSYVKEAIDIIFQNGGSDRFSAIVRNGSKERFIDVNELEQSRDSIFGGQNKYYSEDIFDSMMRQGEMNEL